MTDPVKRLAFGVLPLGLLASEKGDGAEKWDLKIRKRAGSHILEDLKAS